MTEAIKSLQALRARYWAAGKLVEAKTMDTAIDMLRRTMRQMEEAC